MPVECPECRRIVNNFQYHIRKEHQKKVFFNKQVYLRNDQERFFCGVNSHLTYKSSDCFRKHLLKCVTKENIENQIADDEETEGLDDEEVSGGQNAPSSNSTVSTKFWFALLVRKLQTM